MHSYMNKLPRYEERPSLRVEGSDMDRGYVQDRPEYEGRGRNALLPESAHTQDSYRMARKPNGGKSF